MIDAAKVIETVSYKPGWQFHVESFIRDDLPSLLVIATFDDSRRPGQTVEVAQRQIIPTTALGSVDAFLAFVDMTIAQLEEHERREWLKVGDVLWRDPHFQPAKT